MRIKLEKEKAFQIEVNGKKLWLPKSQSWLEGKVLCVKDWWAKKNFVPDRLVLEHKDFVKYFQKNNDSILELNKDSVLEACSQIYKPNDKQLECILKASGKPGFIFALAQGVGKTKTCLDEIAILDEFDLIKAVVIIVPNDVKYSWAKEINIHFLKKDEYVFYTWIADIADLKREQKKQKEFLESPKKKFFIINYDSVIAKKGQKFLKQLIEVANYEVYCNADEIHNLINRKSVIGQWFADNMGLFKFRRGSSGTLLRKHQSEIWNILQFIDPNILGMSYWKFAEEFFRIHIDEFGGYHVKEFLKGKKEDLRKAMEPFMVYGEAPKTPRMPDKKLWVDLLPKAYDEYLRLTKEILQYVKIDDPELSALALKENWSELKFLSVYIAKHEIKTRKQDQHKVTRLKRLANGFVGNAKNYEYYTESGLGCDLPKIKALISEVDGTDLTEDKLIICGTQIPLIFAARDTLKEKGYEVLYIDGSVVGQDRSDVLDKFEQSLEHNILVANTDTVSTGLNLQYANRMMFLNLEFAAEVHNQMRTRIDRQGQLKNCYFTYFFCLETIEEAVLPVIYKRSGLQADLFRTQEFIMDKLFEVV